MVGLSPPTRGNLSPDRLRQPTIRSIPAHAGEPEKPNHPNRLTKVYPRPRGGTPVSCPSAARSHGLSPPTRGNPLIAVVLAAASGSIPAHAGEPGEARQGAARQGVYPRPRGGTFRIFRDSAENRGLSPPTRGNHRRICRREQGDRSIPAHAGEPPTPRNHPE